MRILLAIIMVAGLVALGALFFFKSETETDGFKKTDYTKLDLDDIPNLMVVAHPDDEVLWGGQQLISEDYLVVCVTCGSDNRRVKEFLEVMSETKDKYVMLGYPDKTDGKRDNWDVVYDEIKEDLQNIYGLKKWNKVITHNPNGEYGHIHHKMTNVMMSDIVDKRVLSYFGKYYSKDELNSIEDTLVPLNEEVLNRKKEILDLYKSQDNTINKTFGHMIAYEDVVTYEDWMNNYAEKQTK